MVHPSRVISRVEPVGVPSLLHTPRLVLRAWTPADAPLLEPILVANAERLSPWLPAHVASPAPVNELANRLSGYAADFAAGRAFRFALFPRDAAQSVLLGGADLHPRAASGRVPLADADRVEIGYWLAADAEGNGFVVEAIRALLDVAAGMPQFVHAEARVNPRNARSANVARRLGFRLDHAESGHDVWQRDFPASDETDAVVSG